MVETSTKAVKRWAVTHGLAQVGVWLPSQLLTAMRHLSVSHHTTISKEVAAACQEYVERHGESGP